MELLNTTKGYIGNFTADANGNGTISLTTDEWNIGSGDPMKEISRKRTYCSSKVLMILPLNHQVMLVLGVGVCHHKINRLQ
jgi:hypothetical protein